MHHQHLEFPVCVKPGAMVSGSKRYLTQFSLGQRKHLVGSPWSCVKRLTMRVTQEGETLAIFQFLLGCPGVFLWVFCTCHIFSESILHTYMPNVFESVFTLLASMALFFLVLFWVFGKWNCPLMRIIYTDLGGESVWTWVCRGSYYVQECVYLTRSANQCFTCWSLGIGKTDLGFSSNPEKRGQIFEKNHARDLLFVISVSFFNAFVL